MSFVAIIGAGEAGGATAEALARAGAADRVLLVDTARGVAAGKALDIQQAGAITGSHTRLSGTNALASIGGCDVCVVADPFGPAPGAPELGRLTLLAGVAGDAPLVFAGAGQMAALQAAAADLALPWRRLAGAGAAAMASATAAMVALEAGCSAREVAVTVLGTPGGGFVVPWSQAALSGFALEQVLDPPGVRRVEARLASLWPPGPYVLGAAAARVVAAMLTSSREALPVLTMLDGSFGVRGRLGAVPARLSPAGIAHVEEPPLTPRERTALHTALGW